MKNSHMNGINSSHNSPEEELNTLEMISGNKSMNNQRKCNMKLSGQIKGNSVINNQYSNEFSKIISDTNNNNEYNEINRSSVFHRDEHLSNNISYDIENQNEVNVNSTYNNLNGNIRNIFSDIQDSISVSSFDMDIEYSWESFSLGYTDDIFNSEFTESNNTIEIFTDSQEYTDNNRYEQNRINNDNRYEQNRINNDNRYEQNRINKEQSRTSQYNDLDEFESNEVFILNDGESNEIEDTVQILENTVYISSDSELHNNYGYNNIFNDRERYYLSDDLYVDNMSNSNIVQFMNDEQLTNRRYVNNMSNSNIVQFMNDEQLTNRRYVNNMSNSNIVQFMNDEQLTNRRVVLDRYIRQLNNNIRRIREGSNASEANDFMELIEMNYNNLCRKYISRIELNLQNFKLELKDRCTYVGNIRREMIDRSYFIKYKNILEELSKVRGVKMDNLLKEIADLGAYLREDEIDYLTFIITRDFRIQQNKNQEIIKLLKKVYSLIYGKLSKFFLPEKLYKSVRYGELINSTESECLICLVNFNKRSVCVVTDCLHVFHANCMKTWLKTSYNCPKCREKPNS